MDAYDKLRQWHSDYLANLPEPPTIQDELEEARAISLETDGVFSRQEVLLATLISLVRERL